MYLSKSKTVCEYIWIGGKGELRSKTRVTKIMNLSNIPEWNYDASSTGQAPSDGNTEGILKPVACYKNPLRKIDEYNSLLVLCETYDVNGNPLETNHRHNAKQIFDSKLEEEPWYGLEQEYFINITKTSDIDKHNNFYHYCGLTKYKKERQIVEKHFSACLDAGLTISGINVEVADGQWEFQVGPCEGIKAGDDLIVARYLLERIAEEFDATIDFRPKPSVEANGSGCHTNFSTKTMRGENGLKEIYNAIDKLSTRHEEHIKFYGKENELRLTGHHETASYTTFSWGKGTRNTSIRIPNQVVKDNCGYFEDRRPAANIDPYLVTSKIFETCCIEPL
jgi:glutamine synthetase